MQGAAGTDHRDFLMVLRSRLAKYMKEDLGIMLTTQQVLFVCYW
jgi:hypothetical protein